MTSQESDARKLLQAAMSETELVIAWRPGTGRTIIIFNVEFDDERIVDHQIVHNSPFRVRIPPEWWGKTVEKVTWSISMGAKQVSRIVLGVRRGDDSARAFAWTKKAYKRGEFWNASSDDVEIP